MGLDMFLDGVEWIREEWDKDFNVTKKHQRIFTRECYWRKANQIHRWFVENVQYGEDDCHEYEVTREQLHELKKVCEEVKNNPEKAEELLPTQSGFFFGSTEYDEMYFYDINDTINQLNALFNIDEKYDYFVYHSSW